MAALKVNGEPIEEAAVRLETTAMLKLMVERMPSENMAALCARAREWAEENLIESTLLRQAARNDPGPLDAPAGSSPEDELRMRMDRLMARITSPASPPRHKEVVAYYLKNRSSFDEPESIRAAHILKKVDESHDEDGARAAIEQAQAELAKGRPFGEVADEWSDSPGQGGDLGYFVRGHMVKAFEEIVFGMTPGEVSGIFHSEFGFHIATLLDRRPAGIRRLEEVQDRIAEHLLSEKKQKRLHQFVDQLRLRAVIRKNEALV